MNCARLARVVHERHPDWSLHAVGGPYLGAEVVKSPGGTWIADTGTLSAIGILNSLKVIPRSILIAARMRKFIREQKVDAAVFCDWGAFNCRQIDYFKMAGVPVLYYFPPGSWRQKGKGDLGIVGHVPRIATPFQWSAQRLSDAGADVEWVGHPMLELRQGTERREALRREFGIAPGETLIAMLPGSRAAEVSIISPHLAGAAEILKKTRGAKMRFLVASPQYRVEAARSHFPADIPIIADRAADVLFASDAAIVKSGTATLEAAVIGVPEVLVYDLHPLLRLEWKLLWSWKKIPFIGMPNIILGREAIPELLGENCNPQKIADQITALLDDTDRRETMLADFAEIRRQLGESLSKPATIRTAEMLEEMVNK